MKRAFLLREVKTAVRSRLYDTPESIMTSNNEVTCPNECAVVVFCDTKRRIVCVKSRNCATGRTHARHTKQLLTERLVLIGQQVDYSRLSPLKQRHCTRSHWLFKTNLSLAAQVRSEKNKLCEYWVRK